MFDIRALHWFSSYTFFFFFFYFESFDPNRDSANYYFIPNFDMFEFLNKILYVRAYDTIT